MDLETAQTTTTTKLPFLKQGKYDMWRLRIEQYFQVRDYAIWDVIENGNSFKPEAQTTTNADGSSTTLVSDYPIWEVIENGNGPVSISIDTQGQIKVLPPRTVEEILARERERKARTTLFMALPEGHLAKFHKMTDAKEMWEAIRSRFGGNDK
ncbi:hypothetical protein Tco_1345334 [Tanacetum coccineum]